MQLEQNAAIFMEGLQSEKQKPWSVISMPILLRGSQWGGGDGVWEGGGVAAIAWNVFGEAEAMVLNH